MNGNSNPNVTDILNSVRGKKLRQFATKAIEINQDGYDFDYSYFPELSQGKFRQNINRLGDLIVKTVNSRPCSYKIKGFKVYGTRDDVTLEGMGVGINMEEILHDVRFQPPKLHDIKINFKSNLHSILLKKDFKKDPTNSRISLGKWNLQEHVYVNVSVYPETVQLDISCSGKPIIYDLDGAQEFSAMLGRIYQNFVAYSLHYNPNIPRTGNWLVTNYHFNRDGHQEYSGPRYNRTIKDFVGGFHRFYSKLFPDGKIRMRWEVLKNPNCTVDEELAKMSKGGTSPPSQMVEVDMKKEGNSVPSLEKVHKTAHTHPLIDEQLRINREEDPQRKSRMIEQAKKRWKNNSRHK